jgi:hypothetical protein
MGAAPLKPIAQSESPSSIHMPARYGELCQTRRGERIAVDTASPLFVLVKNVSRGVPPCRYGRQVKPHEIPIGVA